MATAVELLGPSQPAAHQPRSPCGQMRSRSRLSQSDTCGHRGGVGRLGNCSFTIRPIAKCDRNHIVRDFIDAAARALNLQRGCRNQSLTVAKCPPPAILRFMGPASPPPGPFLFENACSTMEHLLDPGTLTRVPLAVGSG